MDSDTNISSIDLTVPKDMRIPFVGHYRRPPIVNDFSDEPICARQTYNNTIASW